ncbi:hypothetical protein CVT24_010954 [Panaeolus cyanescens]|uniref:C2H2-type domain-containing protein n=1 Tax=Panaeolus cyanescens TaxID=181874 RepID=A0A409YVX2_9AGAR|nr:hypothetical protein CVT24_010954 [Panaeolus cyanescens]
MYPYYNDNVLLNAFPDPGSKHLDEYCNSFDYSPLLSDGDFLTPSSSETSSPRSSASGSLTTSEDSMISTPSHIDPMSMFNSDDLFQEAPRAKRRSWTSFKNSLPDSISAGGQVVTPQRKRSSFSLFPNHSAPHRRTRRESYASFSSSRDAEGESDRGTDDEYLPRPTKSKSRRHAPYTRPTKPSVSLPVTPSRSPSKRPRLSPPSRNTQSSATKAQELKEVVDTNAIESIDFICPECGWQQLNRRIPDFKRHLKTHLRNTENDHSNGYWCKGVRVQDASRYLIPPEAVSYVFKGEERIGGCMHTFSRRDALKRHLDNPNIACVFDLIQE